MTTNFGYRPDLIVTVCNNSVSLAVSYSRYLDYSSFALGKFDSTSPIMTGTVAAMRCLLGNPSAPVRHGSRPELLDREHRHLKAFSPNFSAV